MTPTAATYRKRFRDDRGSVAGVELPFGMLWLGVVALVVLSFPTWIERTSAARATAAEAARAVTMADSRQAGIAQAQAAADETAGNYGLDPEDLTLTVDGQWRRGGEITAHVTVTIPAIDLPGVGRIGGLRRTHSHTEIIDTYRAISEDR